MTESTALYRKYRPATFDDVLGQAHIVTALKSAIESGTIAHAYLFSGSRGTGKTSLARIFARAIGTDERDLYEIDAASNRGIDEIRALREQVHTLPFASTYKVYIIDEVHMLTAPAFNALLKTLEEPPEHVVFILATTEPDDLPETIVSRCQTFAFKKPGAELLKEMVMRVAKAEGRSLEPAGADLIALLADGSFRDAHGILQKVLTSSGEKRVNAADVETIAGAPKSTVLLALLDAFAQGDAGGALNAVRTLSAEGVDMRMTLTLLLRLVRAVIVMRIAPDHAAYLKDEFTSNELAAIERHAKESRERVHSKLLARLLDAYMQSGTTYTPELPLELAIFDLCGNDHVQ